MDRVEHRPMFGESGYQRQANDAYWTPSWCTEALLTVFKPRGLVWEPACGTGAILAVLTARKIECWGSDLIDYGIGKPTADFLKATSPGDGNFDIITNPPYEHAEAFVRHALELTKRASGKVAMLPRNEYDCAASRVDLFADEPFALKFVLTKRPRWSADEKASPRHNFAWFIWDWQHAGPAAIRYQARAA